MSSSRGPVSRAKSSARSTHVLSISSKKRRADLVQVDPMVPADPAWDREADLARVTAGQVWEVGTESAARAMARAQ